MDSNKLNSTTSRPRRATDKYRPPDEHPAYAHSVPNGRLDNQVPGRRGVKKLVLCFDGTGNKFHGDDSDSNILKIFRMLDRTADDQYHYYQPGIGTYVVSGSLTHTSLGARINSAYQKAKDSAIGSSFDQHVVGGYRFLMRFYNPGDEIYMFGFSRGSYIARFLAEMLDYVGLLSHGNEEMVKFAWKAFAQWQCRHGARGSEKDVAQAEIKKHQMYSFMKGFRETFSRPVCRIRFLGLFDTVNSVPRFETAWLQRSKFPYTARSSAKVIRHAVSIDERRAKFRQDLIYQGNPRAKRNRLRPHRLGKFTNDRRKQFEQVGYMLAAQGAEEQCLPSSLTSRPASHHSEQRGRRRSQFLSPESQNGDVAQLDDQDSDYAPYRPRSRSRPSRRASVESRLDGDMASMISSVIPPSELDPDWDEEGQDIDEVWFAGGHADIGGGWEALPDSKSASHIPLTWMVREAMKAGLTFDMEKVVEMGCTTVLRSIRNDGVNGVPQAGQDPSINVPDIRVGSEPTSPDGPPSPEASNRDALSSSDHSPEFHEMMSKANTARIHDSLSYGAGLGAIAVTAWKFMEWLPFRRMDLLPGGSWAPIRWPLPRGEVRDIPDGVRVHCSVLKRMQQDENYRPGNLIVGGGGRGVRRAPAKYGMGEWECVDEPGDPVGEIWVKRSSKQKMQ